MTTTGKSARKRYGTRVSAKQAKSSRRRRKAFGKLPVSVSRGNAEQFIRNNGGEPAELADVQKGGAE